MESDWTGTKYATSHFCYGKPCDKEELKKGKYVPEKDSLL